MNPTKDHITFNGGRANAIHFQDGKVYNYLSQEMPLDIKKIEKILGHELDPEPKKLIKQLRRENEDKKYKTRIAEAQEAARQKVLKEIQKEHKEAGLLDDDEYDDEEDEEIPEVDEDEDFEELDELLDEPKKKPAKKSTKKSSKKASKK